MQKLKCNDLQVVKKVNKHNQFFLVQWKASAWVYHLQATCEYLLTTEQEDEYERIDQIKMQGIRYVEK